ncbi:unnamed protein product [Nesidiocoris tenuis]|uniref:Uncharacterized protein n=1 Tax=Nesidiocoris tenuis TaxID=355587 RepID=A0A6H5GNF4_9HEMI|nr:unnamed protein product [Nesidiocoris tenuis]
MRAQRASRSPVLYKACVKEQLATSCTDYAWLTPVIPGLVVKPLKLRDVQNLLKKHFGPSWDNDDRLSFHENIIASAKEEGPTEDEQVGEEEERGVEEHLDRICEPIEEDGASRYWRLRLPMSALQSRLQWRLQVGQSLIH